MVDKGSTSTNKRIKSIHNGREEMIFNSIAEAANHMIKIDKFKNYNLNSIRRNISTAAKKSGERSLCCDRQWEHVLNDDFVFNQDDWKQYDDTYLYFSKKHDFAYSKNKKRKVYGDKKNFLQIHKIGRVNFIDALWITFNGPIEKTQYIDYKNENCTSNFYENICARDISCKYCENVFIPTHRNNREFCSRECWNKHGGKVRKQKEREDLKSYISAKIKKYKKPPWNLKTEDVAELCKDRKCHYCDIDLILREEQPQHNTLTIDAKECDKGHVISNIVPCCLFCNRMKNTYPYDQWSILLKFLRGEIAILDLSDIKYTKIDQRLENEYTKTAYHTLWHENKVKYRTKEDAREGFLSLYKKQNGVDSIYNIFPIIVTTQNHLLNASCDQVIASDPDEHQIIPLFMNYAKSDTSTEDFKNYMKMRNYLTWDLSKASIILPLTYYEDSYFINKLFKTKNRFGVKNITDWTPERRQKLSESKTGKCLGADNKKSKPIKSIDLQGNEKVYANSRCAAEALGLQSKAFTNIWSCANGNGNTAYGLKWEFVK